MKNVHVRKQRKIELSTSFLWRVHPSESSDLLFSKATRVTKSDGKGSPVDKQSPSFLHDELSFTDYLTGSPFFLFVVYPSQSLI